MLLRLDWKFAVTLVATLAGVLVPVWLWQADLSSKSLSLKLISATELQPQGVTSLGGVQVSLDGKPVKEPFIAVLQLSNNGSRPISASDFEGPIEVSVGLPAEILKIQVTKTEPPDLKPVSVAASGIASIQPLLLNPKDSFKLAVLTSGGTPVFSARSRIAGVSSVVVSDAAATRATRIYWMKSVVGTLLLSMYVVVMAESLAALRRKILRPWSMAAAIVAASGGTLLILPFSDDVVASMTEFLTRMAIAVAIAIPFHLLRKRPLRDAA